MYELPRRTPVDLDLRDLSRPASLRYITTARVGSGWTLS